VKLRAKKIKGINKDKDTRRAGLRPLANKDKDTRRAGLRPLAKMPGLRPLDGSLVSLLMRIHYERKGLLH